MTRRLPEGFDLAGIARPGDVVLLRVTHRSIPPGQKERLAERLRYAAEYWGVRFVLLDSDYFDIDRGKEPT